MYNTQVTQTQQQILRSKSNFTVKTTMINKDGSVIHKTKGMPIMVQNTKLDPNIMSTSS